MKKLIVFLLFIALVWGLYSFRVIKPRESIDIVYRDSFSSLDTGFWFVGEWQTHKRVPHKIVIEDGALKMAVHETDLGPYLVSKPIPLEGKTVIYIKRKVYQHYGNDAYTGGLALFETDDTKLVPEPRDDTSLNLGNALFLVEYVHDLRENQTRPGTDVFRVLPTDWRVSDGVLLVDPIFDEWYIEEIEYHVNSGKLTYTVNGKAYGTRTQIMKADNFRLFMHAYGAFTGHYVKMEYLDIKLMNAE